MLKAKWKTECTVFLEPEHEIWVQSALLTACRLLLDR